MKIMTNISISCFLILIGLTCIFLSIFQFRMQTFPEIAYQLIPKYIVNAVVNIF